MSREVRNAYDTLSADYHLMYADWRKAVDEQGRVLDSVIRKLLGKRKQLSVLDCSCGIGTQAIGLARRGYRVHATDLSPQAVARARVNAEKMKAQLTFGVSDFRELARRVPGQFDVIVSCDNSLPHLLTEKDVLSAAKNMRAKLKPGGLVLLGVRDYDAFLPARPLGTGPFLMKDKSGERIYLQSWEWEKKLPIYMFRLFILKGRNGRWTAKCVTAKYRAWSRPELLTLFLKAGFSGARWLMPGQTQFKQPLGVFS